MFCTTTTPYLSDRRDLLLRDSGAFVKDASQTSVSQVKRLNFTDLRLGCIEGDGFGRNAGPEQREGLHVAPPLRNLSNGDIGVSTKNLIVKRFEIPCSQTDTIKSLINSTTTRNTSSTRRTSRIKAHVDTPILI